MRALKRSALSLALSVTVVFGLVGRGFAAETIKIGTLKIAAGAPLYIAKEKGYCARQGLDADIVFTDAPQTMGQAVMSGDIDFSMAALSAALYNVAEQGGLRFIAGGFDEWPGFSGLAVVVSDGAYEGGLRSLKALGHHSFAIAGVGTVPQYDLSVIAAKYGFDYHSVKLSQLGSLPNAVSAVVGGGADETIVGFSYLRLAVQEKRLHLLAHIGDEMRMQVAVLVTSANVADNQHDRVERFLTAYRQGARDYHDAFTGPKEARRDGPTADEVYAIISKYMDQPLDVVKLGIAYFDRDARLDTADVLHQIAFYESQGMVKPEVDGGKIIDTRYVVPLPEK